VRVRDVLQLDEAPGLRLGDIDGGDMAVLQFDDFERVG